MRSALLVGLDIGTSYVKAAAFRADGKLLAVASSAYPTYYPQPGWAEQCPADWQEAIRATLKELVARLGSQATEIAALGLSSHAPSLIPVDDQGVSLIARIPIWQDERSMEQAQSLLKEIGSDWVGLGMPFASFAAKLKWLVETQPEVAARARYALGVKAYLIHWLTGRYATDPSSEPGNTEGWQSVCSACNWSVDRLVPILPASAVVGSLRPDLCREFELKHPMPVVMGLNDGGSATLGNGALRPGEGIVTLSTNGVVFLVTDRPVPAADRLARAIFCWPYVGDRWIIGGQTKTGAASLQWWLGILQDDPAGGADFERRLLDCAQVPPGSNGVMFLPYLMGQGTPRDNPSAKGAFTGLTLRTNPKDLTLAVLEGVAFTLRDVLEELARISPAPKTLNITGGGAQSVLWRQIVADVLRMPLKYSEADSCLGAAMLAAVGVGEFANIESACYVMKRTQGESQPRQEAVGMYDRLYGEYIRIRDACTVSS